MRPAIVLRQAAHPRHGERGESCAGREITTGPEPGETPAIQKRATFSSALEGTPANQRDTLSLGQEVTPANQTKNEVSDSTYLQLREQVEQTMKRSSRKLRRRR